MPTLLLTLSNKILNLIGIFFTPSVVRTRRRKKIILYADRLADELDNYVNDVRYKTKTKRAWKMVEYRLSKYKNIRKILR